MPSFESVYVFVADALRADAVPRRIEARGQRLDTIASSTISPTSFASILSGLYPPEHGVYTFNDRLDDEQSLLSLDGLNTSFWQVILEGGLYDVLGQDPETSASPTEIEPPFFYIERELSTHAPYDEWRPEFFESDEDPRTIWGNQTTEPFFDRFQGDWNTVRERYHAGAETVADRFLDRLDSLAERGLLEDTLVVFTADHGELLGEYGMKSHTTPVVEELVRVPTVLVADGVDLSREIDRSVVSHVDLAATVSDVLDVELPWEVSGMSFFRESEPWAYSEFHVPKSKTITSGEAPPEKRYEKTIRSVWDDSGGHVFKQSGTPCETRTSLLNYLLYTCARHVPLVGSPWASLGRLPEALRYYADTTPTFGSPKLSEPEAKQIVERIVSEANPSVDDQIEISDDKREHLAELGYT